jgi:hypothetical protein
MALAESLANAFYSLSDASGRRPEAARVCKRGAAHITELEAERDGLREALAPFAEAEAYEDLDQIDGSPYFYCSVHPDHFRRAAAALTQPVSVDPADRIAELEAPPDDSWIESYRKEGFCFGCGTDLDFPDTHEEWCLHHRIEALEAALNDALILLPPERWRLLLPQHEDARKSASRR